MAEGKLQVHVYINDAIVNAVDSFVLTSDKYKTRTDFLLEAIMEKLKKEKVKVEE